MASNENEAEITTAEREAVDQPSGPDDQPRLFARDLESIAKSARHTPAEPPAAESEGLRQAVEALAEQYERDAKAEGYGGELWSTTADALRALLAAHAPEADRATAGEREGDGRLDAHVAAVEHPTPACRDCEVGEPHVCPLLPATPPADDTPPPAVGEVVLTEAESHALTSAIILDSMRGGDKATFVVIERILTSRLKADRAARDTASKAEALREAADAANSESEAVLPEIRPLTRWLRDRAASIEARP